MEATPIDYTTIATGIGGFLGFLITLIVVVYNMQKNSSYHNKNMEKLTIYVEKHENKHEGMEKEMSNLEISINKLTKLSEDADRRLWILENTPHQTTTTRRRNTPKK